MISRETERLILRNFRMDDLDALLDIAQKYEATDVAIYDQPWPQTLGGMIEVITWLSSEDTFAAIELKDNSKLIGLLQFQRKEAFPDEIVHGFGYVFDSDYHGKGYAKESCVNILEYLFNDLKAAKVTAGTAVPNKSSRKLLKKLGFTEVSRKKTHFRKDSAGNPIEFLSAKYELSAAAWKAVHSQVNNQ